MIPRFLAKYIKLSVNRAIGNKSDCKFFYWKKTEMEIDENCKVDWETYHCFGWYRWGIGNVWFSRVWSTLPSIEAVKATIAEIKANQNEFHDKICEVYLCHHAHLPIANFQGHIKKKDAAKYVKQRIGADDSFMTFDEAQLETFISHSGWWAWDR